MRWCRFRAEAEIKYGVVEGDQIREVHGSPFGEYTVADRCHALVDVELLMPVVPLAMYAVSGNFVAHAEWVKQYGVSLGERADIQFGHRSPSALVGPNASVVIPPDAPGPLEAEGELIAVIARTARNVTVDAADDYIPGYTLGNDIGDRGWQLTDRTNWRWKNSDTFKPIGPVIATGSAALSQELRVRVNGQVMSGFDNSVMRMSPAEAVARLSTYVTLSPGDLLWLGAGAASQPALVPGDTVSVECDGVGSLTNHVVQG